MALFLSRGQETGSPAPPGVHLLTSLLVAAHLGILLFTLRNSLVRSFLILTAFKLNVLVFLFQMSLLSMVLKMFLNNNGFTSFGINMKLFSVLVHTRLLFLILITKTLCGCILHVCFCSSSILTLTWGNKKKKEKKKDIDTYKIRHACSPLKLTKQLFWSSVSFFALHADKKKKSKDICLLSCTRNENIISRQSC